MRAIVERRGRADRRRRAAHRRPLRLVHGRRARRGARASSRCARCSTRSPRPPTTPRSPACWAAASARAARRWSARSSPPTRRTPSRYLVHLNQSGLGLPDESYYREDVLRRDPHGLRRPPRAPRRAGRPPRPRAARRAASWSSRRRWPRPPGTGSRNRDAEKTYTLMTAAELRERAPRSTGTPGSTALGAPEGAFAEVVVRQPSFVEAAAALWQERPLAQWQAWLALRTASACADFLSEAVVRGGLRLLRPHAVGHAADPGPVEARGGAGGGLGRRGGRAGCTSSGTSRRRPRSG